MKLFTYLPLLATPLAAAALVLAQQPAPPANKPPDEQALKRITERMEKLEKTVFQLRNKMVADLVLADIEIYHKAAAWIIKHAEWQDVNAAQWTDEAVTEGILRASQAGEWPWLRQAGQDVIRAYRSRVDGSVQPYCVSAPADYGRDPAKKWRLDVVLHGRDAIPSEVKFLHQHNGSRATPKDQDFIRLDVFGRGSNGYRWAGEADVLEALRNYLEIEARRGRGLAIDPNRIVLRGFSMGGAGSWHLGLHYPSQWAAIGPGAGFTTTHGYIKDLPKLPSYQEACLHIYDAVDYAENAFNVPVVAYAGANDSQKAAGDAIQAKLKPLNIPMTFLIAPGLEHKMPPEWEKKAEAEYAKYVGPGKKRSDYPNKVRFVTYTVKYPECAWVKVLALDKHYEAALVEAEKTDAGLTVKTANVRVLALTLPEPVTTLTPVTVDGAELKAQPSLNQAGQATIYVEKKEGKWTAVLQQKLITDLQRHLQKATNLQGPIDDAFMDSFLCVRGTGTPWHPATHIYAQANLERFKQEWSQYLRGDLPVKDDVDVTDDDMVSKNLVLFGDPGSNSLIAQVIDGLPLKWTRQTISLGSKTVRAADHVPVMIYPSPLATGRYVVLNSGHTFHARDFAGTNALLYPRLGDYALLKLGTPGKDTLGEETVVAGLFDEWWKLPSGVEK